MGKPPNRMAGTKGPKSTPPHDKRQVLPGKKAASAARPKAGGGAAAAAAAAASAPASSQQPTDEPDVHGSAHADPFDQKSSIPFNLTDDSILLVGEGDLSFARSLVVEHVALDVTASVYDSEAELVAKYPQSAAHAAAMLAEEPGTRILYSVDATKLLTNKALKGRTFDRVVFNFPHVGGRTKDVNRQVRANQEMLVAFFAQAGPLLREAGSIVVTLFEGEPYTLWNIRDLARHSGLQVQRSFKFVAARYPGYEHRRTLGNIHGGGGWRGEERQARTYVFVKKEEPRKKRKSGGGLEPGANKRRKAGDSSDEEG